MGVLNSELLNKEKTELLMEAEYMVKRFQRLEDESVPLFKRLKNLEKRLREN